MQRATRASCCIRLQLTDWTERCVVKKKKKRKETLGKIALTHPAGRLIQLQENNQVNGKGKIKGLMHGGAPKISQTPRHAWTLHRLETLKTVFVVIRHTRANTLLTNTHKRHPLYHTSCHLLSRISAGLPDRAVCTGSAQHTHIRSELRAHVWKLRQKRTVSTPHHTHVCSFSAGLWKTVKSFRSENRRALQSCEETEWFRTRYNYFHSRSDRVATSQSNGFLEMIAAM